MKIYPLKLKSVTKNIIWGGTRLSDEFGKGQASEKIAEAWTLSLREEGVNTIENGEFKGKTLDEYIKEIGAENVIGKQCDVFPLLVKLIDACDKLSVQVHPDDDYAKSHGLDAGKTEMWYIVDAKPGATLVYGLNKQVNFDKESFKKAAQSGNLEEYLNYVEVHKGDVFFIPAGLVHAIGDGILIAEIQQNSNTTYRIYDYNRTDKNGNKRELHIDKALETIKPHISENKINTAKADTSSLLPLANCDYFSTHLLKLNENENFSFVQRKMIHFVCLSGTAFINYKGNSFEISKGDAYLIPASMEDFTISSSTKTEIIAASL